MTGSRFMKIACRPISLACIFFPFMAAGCSEPPTCEVSLINGAAGIGSMQRFVVSIGEDLSQSSHIHLVDPPEPGLVTLKLINSELNRLPNGEQSSVGRFHYEVDGSQNSVRKECEGELTDCAEEVANAVLSLCPSE